MYNINSKFVVGDNYVSPDNNSLAGFATHIDRYGYGGLKTFSLSSMIYNPILHYIGSGSATMSNNRSSVGLIVYLNSSKQYYTCYEDSNVPKFAILPGLTTGSPTFPGLTSSAGIYILSGNLVLNGGNIATTGTASATQITASTGFRSPGTSNLTTLNVSTISSSGLATLTDLYVPGNTQLGNTATDTTSVLGTLNVVYNSSTSGSITSDANGNLILDGSGVSSGVLITDGVLWLGVSGSTGIQVSSGSYGGTSYTGGMISSSMKIVALNGFANRTSDGAASFEVDTAGNLLCYSLKETSLRLYKHEIYYITESQLLNISKLKPVTFLYNQDVPLDVNDTQLRQAGFIALLVLLIYPEVAWYKEGKLAGLQYQRLTAYLTRGIQELAELNKLLKSRVLSLELLVNGILQGAE